MMTGAILRSWKAVKHHVPLIKFRKGGPFRENAPSASAASGGAVKSGGGAPASRGGGGVIEDWELPPYYRRAPLDDKEMDAINSGGAY